ncbi:MAG: hypothetical protein ACHQT8_03600 [Chlamydiales bacterium]
MTHTLSDQSEVVENLLRKGELHLMRGELVAASRCFNETAQLAPSDPSVFFRQGLAFFEYGSNEGKEKTLLIACKKFKTALALNGNLIEAWHAWGNALFLLGTTYHEHHYFQDSEEKYSEARSRIGSQKYDASAELYWDHGAVHLQLAIHSGEAVDFHSALHAFEKARAEQTDLPAQFWNDFGRASLYLGECITDTRLYVKAMSCFKHAISLDAKSQNSWAHLGQSLQKLYGHTHDEDHFAQANDCFASALTLAPEDTELWLHWANFLLESGRRTKDLKRLRSAIEKCHHAYACDPSLALACAIWAEALALLGLFSERLDLIYEAEHKISQAATLDPESIETIYSYGMCLNAFGRYYNDYDYYYQAIEKFQEGLSLDRTEAKLWHAIAETYTYVAGLDEDLESWEKSLRFYAKALDLACNSYYIFDYALALFTYGSLTGDPTIVEQSIYEFERALGLQKNAPYTHPDWLFHYASALDFIGDFLEEDSYYSRAIEIFSHVLMLDPDFSGIHHKLGLAFSHMGDLMGETEQFFRALHHFRLALKQEEENEQVLLDLAITLINIAQRSQDPAEADQLYREAEHKMTQAAKLGSLSAYYHLSCLYSILGQYEKAMRFILKAEKHESLPPLDELLADDWLDGLRTTSDFRDFLSHLERR